MEEYKLIRFGDDYYLLDNRMAKNVGEYFMERIMTGEMDLFHVDSLHDTVHEGFKILGSTRQLEGVPLILREQINVGPRDLLTPEDLRGAMLFMEKVSHFKNKGIELENPLVIIENYTESIRNQWDCVIKTIRLPGPISGGFIPSGVIGGIGLQHHPVISPHIENGRLTIISVK